MEPFSHDYRIQGRSTTFVRRPYLNEEYSRSQIVPLWILSHTVPLEIWHSLLCLALGGWIWRIGYSTYELRTYASLLHYCSPTFFMLLLIGFGSLGVIGLILPCRPLRRTVAAFAATLWGFTATYYLMGIQHPIGFPTCAILAAQQMTVFIGLRKVG